MSKLGLVKKQKGAHQKKYRVLITEKRKRTYEQIPKDSLETAFGVLTSSEKRQFGVFLSKLANKGRSVLGLDYRPPFLRKETI
jgi:hypothetical protein